MIFLRSILNAIIATLLIFTTGGIGSFAHFCKGNLVTASVVVPVDPCNGGMCMRSLSTDTEEERTHFKGICCEDVADFWQTDTPKSSEKVSLNNIASTVYFQETFSIVKAFKQNKIFKNLFSRPPPGTALFIVFQNFRL